MLMFYFWNIVFSIFMYQYQLYKSLNNLMYKKKCTMFSCLVQSSQKSKKVIKFWKKMPSYAKKIAPYFYLLLICFYKYNVNFNILVLCKTQL